MALQNEQSAAPNVLFATSAALRLVVLVLVANSLGIFSDVLASPGQQSAPSPSYKSPTRWRPELVNLFQSSAAKYKARLPAPAPVAAALLRFRSSRAKLSSQQFREAFLLIKKGIIGALLTVEGASEANLPTCLPVGCLD